MSKFESDSIEEAYYDRNQLVLVCAQLAMKIGYSVRVNIDDPDWPVVIINLPQGQISYHVPQDEMIGEYPMDYNDSWDGHDLELKRKRIDDFLKETLIPPVTYSKMKYDKTG